MSKTHLNFVKANRLFTRLIIGFTIFFMSVAWLLPLMSGVASASQLTSRSLSIATAQPSVSNNWTYTFTYVSSSSAIQSIKFVACTTAVATYGLASVSTLPASCQTTGIPTGININSGVPNGALTGSWTNTTAFARSAVGAGNCNPATSGASNNILCINRTQAATESAASKTLSWTAQTNPSTVNTAFFVGIYLYSDTSWATPTDSGTVASAIVQTLTINAAVAEILNFCVGSTSVDNATSSPGADCTAISGTSVNLGTLDPSTTNISPVSTNGGNSVNGIAMLRSNAINGSTVSYDAIQDTGSNHLGTLRVLGATCSALTGPGTGSPPAASGPFTDQCIDAAGATQNTFTAGSEEFGMTVGGTNCGSTTSYSCSYAGATEHLIPSANYIGAASNAYGTTNGFAWVESGTATQVASATTPVDDEALILKFAATPAITTPFGSYQVKTDFIAVPTY